MPARIFRAHNPAFQAGVQRYGMCCPRGVSAECVKQRGEEVRTDDDEPREKESRDAPSHGGEERGEERHGGEGEEKVPVDSVFRYVFLRIPQ